MPESSKTLNMASLKGRIMIAAGGLALFLGLFNIISYFVALALIGAPFYAVLFTTFASLASVAFFGWWLSNEVSDPIQKVILTAKSLERGSLSTLPQNSGSAETDEILMTLQRISNQMNRIAASMDEAAQGNLNAQIRAVAATDRLGNSFQKLIAKFSSSVQAEKDMLKLRSSLKKLTDETFLLKRGDLTAEVKQNVDETKDISQAVNFLLKELRDIVNDVRVVTSESQNSAYEIRLRVLSYAQMSEEKAKEIGWAANSLRQIPELVQKISGDLTLANSASASSLEKAQGGFQASQQAINLIGGLRQQVQESYTRIQRLSERSKEIQKVAKTIEDLSHRTNLVALNASIQATSAGELGHGFVVVADEVEKLATRASNLNKQVSSLNKSIQAEVIEVEATLETAAREVVTVARLSAQAGASFQDLEKHVSNLSGMHQNLAAQSNIHAQSAEKSFTVFTETIEEIQGSIGDLHDSAQKALHLSKAMETLNMAVARYKIEQAAKVSDVTRINHSNSIIPNYSQPS